nr:hypothetical protein [uncultured Halomonas sp.]
MNVDLEILMTRLRWPTAMTRWWAMQELAALLLTSETQEEVSKRLQAELTRCRLEAESIEILCIFWMAVQQGYRPPHDLGSALSCPSFLAGLLLSDMELECHDGPNPPLEVVPEDFDVPAQFREVHGLGVPRIYHTRLLELQRHTGLPFVSQCAFEWSRTDSAYPEAPIQGDLGYFIRSFGDSATGGFAPRSVLRMLTAYQRTLDVARVFWGVPEEVLLSIAVEAALPVDPTLAFLRSARPSWLPHLGKHVTADATSVEDFIRSMLDSLMTARPGAVLLALVSPIYVDNHEIVELSVVRWRQWGTNSIDAGDLAARFYGRQKSWDYGVSQAPVWGLTTFVPMAELEHVLDHETNAAPMAVVYGISRVGYLQKDLYPSRLYYPIITDLDGQLTVEPSSGELKFSALHGSVATACYWNAGWSPVHPIEMSGLCGTALVGTEDSRQAHREPPPDGHFYLWQITRLRRPNGYGPFSADEPICGVFLQ